MIVLKYPKRQSIAMSNKLLRLYDLVQTTQEDEVRFDLSRSQSLTPFGIIMLASTIYESFRRGKRCSYIRPQNRTLQNFFRQIGFDRYFGLNDKVRRPPKIDTEKVQLRRVEGINPIFVEDAINLLDYNLYISPGLKWVLQFSLMEIMQNALDHSGVQEYYICAYNDRRKRQIRLCIADLGCGIPTSLRRIEKYKHISNDYETIKLATDEGVSCRPNEAGLGLHYIREFISVNEGQMCIISRNGKVFWKFDQGKILKQTMELPFNGTIIKLVFNTSKEWRYSMSDEEKYLI